MGALFSKRQLDTDVGPDADVLALGCDVSIGDSNVVDGADVNPPSADAGPDPCVSNHDVLPPVVESWKSQIDPLCGLNHWSWIRSINVLPAIKGEHGISPVFVHQHHTSHGHQHTGHHAGLVHVHHAGHVHQQTDLNHQASLASLYRHAGLASLYRHAGLASLYRHAGLASLYRHAGLHIVHNAGLNHVHHLVHVVQIHLPVLVLQEIIFCMQDPLHHHVQDLHCGRLLIIGHLDAYHSGPLMTQLSGLQHSGQLDPELSGQLDPHHSGQLDPHHSGQLDPQLSGLLDPQLNGLLDPQLNGLLDPHHSGQLDPQLSGLLDPQLSGQSDPQLSGQLDLGDYTSVLCSCIVMHVLEHSIQ
ncbi:hypothetical protein EMCRGX_G016698 [Ephydatia muelleri]